MSLPLLLRVAPMAGIDAGDIAMAILMLAYRMEVSVVAEVAGCDMLATPSSSVEQIVSRWKLARLKLLGQTVPGEST